MNERELDLWQTEVARQNAAVEGPPEPWTVSGLTKKIRFLLEGNIGEVWVIGEVSNLRIPSSGHCYFTLKDETAVINAVFFRTEAEKLDFPLKDGLSIVVRAFLTVYESRGQYQLRVVEARKKGAGSLLEKFEELKRKLAQEGLFDLSRKKKLPLFPEKIGIVTSLKGAVIQDFSRILQRRAPGITIYIRDVRVQGNGAAQEIAKAIEEFGELGLVDILVVARGGGSLEDLWAFNEEIVARALFRCPIPTVSAVGHETDFTIADLVADVRAPTPSAAAEIVSRDWEEWRQELEHLELRMHRFSLQYLEIWKERLEKIKKSSSLAEPSRYVGLLRQNADMLEQALEKAVSLALERARTKYTELELRLKSFNPQLVLERVREELKLWAARLASVSPQVVLDRGYSMTFDRQGRVLKEAEKVSRGEQIVVVLSKGSLWAAVEKTQQEKERSSFEWK
ncbi:exodeoxyribonuclease VII large subunit [Candidatus Methylacidiphilum infernorum]|uniref:Exodeoxyribonuclease 7 large subunit n=1 Tax=Methylacidiphilum infernorum (isolate V4) TaxID=481448 RepID=B3E155_METI4|nr:exodeoxyribonuclease VII large subunit [Candidatus Methylacidiphilum infernorum]ACD82851.1 Exonuclease VII, large subunit [Methylacidiphilum infernorum V4]